MGMPLWKFLWRPHGKSLAGGEKVSQLPGGFRQTQVGNPKPGRLPLATRGVSGPDETERRVGLPASQGVTKANSQPVSALLPNVRIPLSGSSGEKPR